MATSWVKGWLGWPPGNSGAQGSDKSTPTESTGGHHGRPDTKTSNLAKTYESYIRDIENTDPILRENKSLNNDAPEVIVYDEHFLMKMIQRRYMPDYVVHHVYHYLHHITETEPDRADTEVLQQIRRALCWKNNLGEYSESSQMHAINLAQKYPEFATEGGPRTMEEMKVKFLDNIRKAVLEEEDDPAKMTDVQGSWMSTYFKRAPQIKAFYTQSRWATTEEIFSALDEKVKFPRDVIELRGLIHRLEEVTGTKEVDSWEVRVRNHKRKANKRTYGDEVDKKNTYTAVYKKIKQNDRIKLHPAFHTRSYDAMREARYGEQDLYDEAVELLGLLRGRYRNYYSSGVRCMCARLDKVGLIHYLISEADLLEDLPTAVFLALCVAEFSVRKEFTLQSQQQGALTPFLSWLMEDILKPSATTRWDIIAMIYPTQWILEKCSDTSVQKIYTSWVGVIDTIMPYILDQWAIGVEERVPRDMAVPSSYPRSSGVDSEGWNIVTGAWNNAVRQMRLYGQRLDLECPAIFKCMKLTAHDQMMWAEHEGMGVNKDLAVFKQLVTDGVLPWSGLDCTALEILQAVANACKRHDARFEAWFGTPRERTTTREVDRQDMICGVRVQMDKQLADTFKSLGVFKAKPAHKTKPADESSDGTTESKSMDVESAGTSV